MAEDFTKLSKKQLLELVSQLSVEKPVKVEEGNIAQSQVDELVAQNERLMAALLAERSSAQVAKNIAETNVGSELFDVINLVTKSVGISVTDDRGLVKHYLLEDKGSKVMLTAAQLVDLKRNRPDLFEKGVIAAPSFFTEYNPNVISDLDSFLTDLEFDAISKRIKDITSVDVLYQIYHSIENKRWVSEDENGNQYKDESGSPILKELTLPPKLVLIEQAVSARLREVAGVQLDLHGSE